MTITDRIRAVMRPGCTHEQLLGDVIAEIERLQADAGRLDWLGANATRVADSERYLPLSVYWGAGTHRDVRAAIDKAMKDAS